MQCQAGSPLTVSGGRNTYLSKAQTQTSCLRCASCKLRRSTCTYVPLLQPGSPIDRRLGVSSLLGCVCTPVPAVFATIAGYSKTMMHPSTWLRHHSLLSGGQLQSTRPGAQQLQHMTWAYTVMHRLGYFQRAFKVTAEKLVLTGLNKLHMGTLQSGLH